MSKFFLNGLKKLLTVMHRHVIRGALLPFHSTADCAVLLCSQTTGLTGLEVAKNPHYELGVLYSKILRVLQKMPESAVYRKYTEEIVNSRAEILKNAKTVSEVEEKIGCGQIEEVIVQAENELNLARKMLTWKSWEPLMKEAHPNQWLWPPVK